MIHTLNLKINAEEALEYFNILTTEYQNMRWQYYDDHNNHKVLDPKNNINKIWGWGLQTTYDDIDFVYHCDLDPHNEPPEFFKDTKMVFGFFKKLKSHFKEPFRSFLHVFPPGQYIGKWLPSPPAHFKIFVPITNSQGYKLKVYGPTEVSVTPTPGHIYLVENDYHNEWTNVSDKDVAFFLFSVPLKYKEEVLALTGCV